MPTIALRAQDPHTITLCAIIWHYFPLFTSVVVWFIYVLGSIAVVPEWDVNKHKL